MNSYKRVLIKLSGEALSTKDEVLDYNAINTTALVLKELSQQGIEIGVVVGGGNIIRGRSVATSNRTLADHMGMLATTINSLALQDALLGHGCEASVLSAIEMYQICEPFAQRYAVSRLQNSEIVIFACGIGRPYFSTDTAAALRALEIGADVLICAKNIDGVYDKDPRKYTDAKKYDFVTYDEVIAKNLQALDIAAITLCRDGRLPIKVVELLNAEQLKAAVLQKDSTGTLISV